MSNDAKNIAPEALVLLQERLAFFQTELAKEADPGRRFQLTKEIEEMEGRLGLPASVAPIPQPTPPRVALAKLPAPSEHLFGREPELQQLDEAWENDELFAVTIVAGGGVGKTVLFRRWFDKMRDARSLGEIDVFAWSFHSQGTTDKPVSADEFLHAALSFFGDPDPTSGEAFERGHRLAMLVKKQPTLILLDGLEPLQQPPGPVQGNLKDRTLYFFLRELVQPSTAQQSTGLCVITSRLHLPEIRDEGTVLNIDLSHLSEPSGSELLRALGVDGTDEEMNAAVREFDGHALALYLLGGYLKVTCQGDVRRRGEVGPLKFKAREGGHARRVMEAYEAWFQEGAPLNVLRLLGLFDRPADPAPLDAVRVGQPIPGLTGSLQKLDADGWSDTVELLRESHLILPHDEQSPGTLDCHALVRQHFGTQLEKQHPDSWQEGNLRLFRYFKSVSREKPRSAEDLVPVLASIMHGCKAGRYQEAVEIYHDRVVQGDNFFSTYKLGAFGSEMATLYHFYAGHWDHPVGLLSRRHQAFILRQTGFCQRAVGILDEASKWMSQALEVFEELEDWEECHKTLGGLSFVDLSRGKFDAARVAAARSVELADQLNPQFQWLNRAKLGDVLHNAGDFEEADAVFRRAEDILHHERPDWCLYGVAGLKYCDLQLTLGRFDDAAKLARWNIEWVEGHQKRGTNPGVPGVTELTKTVSRLVLSRVHLADESPFKDLETAASFLDPVLTYLRQAERQDFLVLGLLTNAELSRKTGQLKQAQDDLETALAAADRGGMALGKVDCELELTRLRLAQGDRDAASVSFEKARDAVESMGYGRRRAELEALDTHCRQSAD